MDSSCKNSHFGGSSIRLRTRDSSGVDSKIGKTLEQLLAFRVIAYKPDRHRRCAERRKIVDSIGAASGNHLGVAVVQHKDRRLARNPRDFSVHEDIRHQIAKDDNPLAMESIDDGAKSVHANLPDRIDSTASSKFSATR